MLRYALAAVAGISVFTSCTSPKEEKSLIGYEMKTYRLTSRPGCDGDSACAEFEVSYPIFTGIDSVISQKINRELELVFSLGDPEAETKTLVQEATEFVESYKTFTSEVPDVDHGWFFHGEARVNILTDTLITIRIDEQYYTGGAHGGGGRYFVNINPATGNKVELGSIFKPGFEAQLAKAAEAAFRKNRELSPEADLLENGFEFPDNRFRLNDNYGFTTDGVVFFYNSYEIASYAAGPSEVFVPYSEVLDWLKFKPVQNLKPESK
jgi:hypothetical protein